MKILEWGDIRYGIGVRLAPVVWDLRPEFVGRFALREERCQRERADASSNSRAAATTLAYVSSPEIGARVLARLKVG